MRLYRIAHSVVVGVLLFGPVDVAHGVEIPGLFNTGVDNAGVVLSANVNVVDPHYSVILSPDPSHPGPNAIVAVRGGWVLNDSVSRWISAANNVDDLDPGPYTYRTTFDLTGLDPGTASITGRWATDNQGTDIEINGVSSGITSNSFTSFTDFTLDTGFVQGVNTLDFHVLNLGETINASGLRVEFVASSADAVPEPSTLLLLGIGLIGLGLFGRKGIHA